MVKVTVGNNMKRTPFTFLHTTSLRDILEQTADQTGIDYTVGMLSLDGRTVAGPELDKTLEEWGYTGEAGHNKCFLLSVVKADNAM